MSKTSTELVRHALNGTTMGTRWSALFHAGAEFDPAPVQAALQAAVAEVDAQMSTWKADSDLMRVNAAPVGVWVSVPERLLKVLRLSLEIGQLSGGAFDAGMGDVVMAWGFGPEEATSEAIRAAMTAPRQSAEAALEFGPGKLRKTAPVALDLNGIAKGYGVDRLAEVLGDFGLRAGLVGIDGEMRAMGLRPDGEPWAIAVEEPVAGQRAPHSVLALQDGAVATSGDYRHWVEVQGRRLSHTMEPRRGAPLLNAPASVTVVARTCAEADAWATAMMVLGGEIGGALAVKLGLDVLFLLRNNEGGFDARGVGPLFRDEPG